MDSTNQGFPLGGNPSPFSSWRDVGALHMATLSLPGLTIGLPVWLFSTSIVQSTMILKQSNQRLDDTRVPPQPSTSFVSPSPSYSSLGEDGKTKNQVTEKKKRGKEKKKKEPTAERAIVHRLVKIHTLHHPNLNLNVSSTKETTIIEIVLESHGF